MSDNQYEDYFAFEHQNFEGKKYYTKVSGDDRWSDVLEDFVRFLEGIYKYNIKDQIRLQQPAWVGLDSDYDMDDPWINHYFEIDEEEEADENSGHPGLSD